MRRVASVPAPDIGRPFRVLWLVLLCLAASLASPAVARAQGSTEARLRQQQDELNRIRREREELQRRMRELQSSVRDLSAEVRNLDRQADATARLVRSLDAQLEALTVELATTTASLQAAEAQLGDKRAMLRRRVRNIYKRGPLFEIEALLSARSLGELLARYKYLHQLARRDQALVAQVEALRDRTAQQRALLVRLQDEVTTNRADRAEEERRLRALEQRRQNTLASARQDQKRTQQRLREIEKTEARVRNVIAALEAARRRAESRGSASAPSKSSIRTSDLGKLDWPVEGDILYRFGRVVHPNNTTTRWNGIGIAAPSGTPVKAISDGEVVVAEPVGTYGLTVIVQHGGGDYSVYGSLLRASVKVGARVRKGQTIGTVGAGDPDLPAHLHFEIRRNRGEAVDPLEWLRGSR
ncbi:MAG TPA: peptidoglycan DD-metalloendopeptidase family protein [Gemmatimonadaceae bacterium]|nr:peptidoglycan DD-metalloendopeptidase family protein [Gemmatimonadaceae bacterium]